MQLRMSPGAGRFSSLRSRPLEPPSSLTVTIAERSEMQGNVGRTGFTRCDDVVLKPVQ